VGKWKKSVDWSPTSVRQFVSGGGMRRLEYIAGERARDSAIKDVREWWLPRLERWHDAATKRGRALLAMEIKRLQRALGIKRWTAEEVRQQTRERVRRYRERQRARRGS
jgi:hypothetical protein